jgi:hypothetical protein
MALVEERLGDRVSEPTCCVRSLEEVRSISPTEPEGPSRGGRSAGPSIDELLSSVLEQRLVRQLVYRRLLDDPMERFGGLSPRAAAASGRFCDELEQLVRSLEHHSALERADRTPGPEVAWLRAELGLDAEPLAV